MGGGDRVGRWKEKKKEGEEEILAGERTGAPKVVHSPILLAILGSVEANRREFKGTSSTNHPKVDPSILKKFAPVAFRGISFQQGSV